MITSLVFVVLSLSVSPGSVQTHLKRATSHDPLLGKWASVALEGTDEPVGLNFLPDGRVVGTGGGEKPHTWYYRREPYQKWLDRREKQLRDFLMPDQYRDYLRWQPKGDPSSESISLSPTQGSYLDVGGWVLMLDTKEQALYNPISSFFTRPALVDRWRRRLKKMRADG